MCGCVGVGGSPVLPCLCLILLPHRTPSLCCLLSKNELAALCFIVLHSISLYCLISPCTQANDRVFKHELSKLVDLEVWNRAKEASKTELGSRQVAGAARFGGRWGQASGNEVHTVWQRVDCCPTQQ
jgi:hypothetical protein